jgi:hypothetical protein
MRVGFLLLLILALLAGCSTMNGFVGQGGVGIELKDKKPAPTGVSADTTNSKPIVPPMTPDDNPNMDIF